MARIGRIKPDQSPKIEGEIRTNQVDQRHRVQFSLGASAHVPGTAHGIVLVS